MQETTTQELRRVGRFKVDGAFAAPGQAPHGLAWSGEYLWISDDEEHCIFKVDASSGQVLLKIPFDGDVAGTCWDGSHIWQVDNRTRTCSRIDPESGQIDVALQVDPGEGTLAGVCHDGEDLWLAVTGAGQLRRIRTADGAIVKIHPVETNIVGVGYDGRRIWYTETDSNKIRLLDPATGTELMSYELEGKPSGVAFQGRNNFWYCDTETKQILKFVLVPRS